MTYSTASRPDRHDHRPDGGRPRLVVGVDAGGTSARALVTTLTGRRLGESWAGGANPNTHGAQHAAAQLAEAVEGALDQAGTWSRGAVATVVVGLAGVSALRDPDTRAVMEGALADAGLGTVDHAFTGDDEIAFAAGSPVPDGTVLIAGTGAIATRIVGRRRDRSADGMGWLIGDDGSAFWIGHQAAKETARQLAHGGELSPLARSVAKEVIPGQRPVDGHDHLPEEHARTFARALTAAPPIRLAAFAPMVSQAHELGDPAAEVIVNAAAGHLAQSVHQVRTTGECRPIVLAGGVLLHSDPVREALTRKLALGAAGSRILLAGSTAGGAAWLAALRAGAAESDHGLHEAFTLSGGDRDHTDAA